MAKLDKMMQKLEYNGVSVVDITHRLALIDWAAEYGSYLYPQKISSDMTPEKVSYSAYGTMEYWWLVCAVNNVVDPFYDWIMTDSEVMQYALKIHGEDGINDIHHWLDSDGLAYPEDSPENDRVPVTHIEHMMEMNEDKREIMLVRKDFVTKIEKEFKEIMKKAKPQVQE